MESNWYLYKHTRLDTEDVFYVGIGCKANYARAYETGSKRNIVWRRIVNKTSIKVDIVLDNLSKKEASSREQELIKSIGRIDLNTGPLCNMTDGGDGIWNCLRSENTRKKLSSTKIGKNNPQYGKKQSEETKQKRREALLGQKRSDEIKKKQSLSSIISGQAKKTKVYKGLEALGEYHSISEACRSVGLDPKRYSGKASLVARGVRNQVKGYKFVYV
jgi:hypothetical protein